MTGGERRAVAADVALGAGLGVTGLLSGLSPTDFPRPGPAVAALMAVAGLAQVLRRRLPRAACGLSFGAMGAVALLYGHYESGGSVLIALVAAYSAAVYARDLPFVLATLVAFAALLNLGQPLSDAVWDLFFTLPLLALIVAAGLAVRTWRRRASDSAATVAVLERGRAAAVEEAAEEERRRIARELHDILSHGLSVVALHAGAADQALDKDLERARAAILQARATAEEAIGELQALVRVARANEPERAAPQPTLDLLPTLVEQVRSAGHPAELVVEGTPRDVSAAVQASLYRVAQEGLANALKHGSSGPVTVALRYLPDEVQIQVLNPLAADRGRGAGSRLGLVGVRERVGVFGGRLHVGPRDDDHWTLEASFPAPP